MFAVSAFAILYSHRHFDQPFLWASLGNMDPRGSSSPSWCLHQIYGGRITRSLPPLRLYLFSNNESVVTSGHRFNARFLYKIYSRILQTVFYIKYLDNITSGYCIHKEPLYSTKGRDDITTSKGRRVAQNAFSKIHLGTARFFQTLVVSKFDHQGCQTEAYFRVVLVL